MNLFFIPQTISTCTHYLELVQFSKVLLQAIQSYRETENISWSNQSNSVISRMKSIAFKPDDIQKSLVHVLDLSPIGYILPHVDSIKVIF